MPLGGEAVHAAGRGGRDGRATSTDACRGCAAPAPHTRARCGGRADGNGEARRARTPAAGNAPFTPARRGPSQAARLHDPPQEAPRAVLPRVAEDLLGGAALQHRA
ncbi:hypothetical protein GCM10010294_64310 [Streptomyces griseoloalbus]|nr:hypothetical protein GCM10010294_64310 [Streptomyces griseoloalbus]